MTDWTGRPWQAPHGCWRLLCEFYVAEFGIALPTYDDQVLADDGDSLAALIADEIGAWREVLRGHERRGDGVLIRVAGQPCHIGVVVEPGKFLHVLMAGHESCIARYRDPHWAPRVEGFYRHRDLS